MEEIGVDQQANPDAREVWYDGVDQDCDEGSDYDADGDGFDSDAYGGTDCDDADLTINTDGEEQLCNGIDDDCDESTSDGDPSIDTSKRCGFSCLTPEHGAVIEGSVLFAWQPSLTIGSLIYTDGSVRR